MTRAEIKNQMLSLLNHPGTPDNIGSDVRLPWFEISLFLLAV